MKRISCIVLILVLLFSLASCTKIKRREKIDGLIYRYHYGENNFTEEKEYYTVIGLTKEGKQKKELTIVSEINGIKVVAISRKITSDNLEILYLNSLLCFPKEDTFKNCPNLKKVMSLSKENWGEKPDNYYYNYIEYRHYKGKPLFNQYIEVDNIKQYFNIYFYIDLPTIRFWGRSNLYRPANIVYFINEEELYDLDFNENIIEFPKDPIKEGYEFKGWYKEKECINKWDIEKDELPTIYISGMNIRYEVTKLYAKWEEIK